MMSSRLLLVMIAGLLALAAFAQPELVPPVAAGKEKPDPVPVLQQLRAPDVEGRLAVIERIRKLFYEGRLTDEIIPPLCEMVRSPDARVRVRAATVLGVIHPIMRKAYADALLIAICDPEPAVRAAAAHSLGLCWQGRLRLMENSPDSERVSENANAFYPTPGALAALRAAQKDANPGVYRAATFALAIIGDLNALAALQPWLQDPDVKIRLEALDVLRNAHRPEAVPIIAAVKDASPDVCRRALQALVEYHTPEATDMLLAALASPEADLRRIAVHAFVSRKEPRAVEPLLALLQDPTPKVSLTACQALAYSGDPRAVEPLLALLKSADAVWRITAVEALTQVDDPRVPDALAAILHDPDPNVQQAAASTLAWRKDPRALDPLAVMLKSVDVETRRNTAATLEGSITNPRAVDLLLTALRDPDHHVRILALQSLNHCTKERVVPVIGALLDEPDFDIRRAAIQALEAIGLPAALEPLLKAMHDRNEQIRQYAGSVLQEFRAELPVAPLLQVMKDPDPAMRKAVAPLFIRCKDRKAYDGLALGLQDPDEQVRLAILQALQRMGGMDSGLGPLAGAVIELAKHPNPAIRAAALYVLAYSKF